MKINKVERVGCTMCTYSALLLSLNPTMKKAKC